MFYTCAWDLYVSESGIQGNVTFSYLEKKEITLIFYKIEYCEENKKFSSKETKNSKKMQKCYGNVGLFCDNRFQDVIFFERRDLGI